MHSWHQYIDIFVKRAFRALDVLEGHLTTHEYVVSDHITLADIVIATLMIKTSTWVMNDDIRTRRFPSLVRHFEAIANQPQFKPTLTPIQYLNKPIQTIPVDL